ncbi:hypothetical protein ITX31_14565 [Arthrobacter gandavensis]|uniref:hypothetical protein n=1 Tax=Arthrobacter gandavensis TaxID=169960 RepID=UPI00188F8238|nr:hypothetical protein [Arthrobacter gandavensis]MBF4995327.1 hypothetical protein [Arthrobacter gandavensis]
MPFSCPDHGAIHGAIPQVTSTGGAVFHAGEVFTLPELQGLCRDGLVKRVYGETFLRWDVRVSPLARALAAQHSLPEQVRGRYAFGWMSAAWIFGCADPPARLALLADSRRRSTALPAFSGAVLHEVALGPADRMLLGTVPVTHPLRTAYDVALHFPPEESVPVLLALARQTELNCPPSYLKSLLRSGYRIPGTRRALEAVEQVAAALDG